MYIVKGEYKMKTETKLNSGKIVCLNVLSFAFALIGTLIYKILPVSNLANGVEHSPKDALFALIISPIAFLVATVLFCLIFKDFKMLQTCIDKVVLIPVGLISAASLAFSFITSIAFVIDQFKLGFVAPTDGTKWATLGTVIIILTVLLFIITFGAVYVLKIRSKK